jgi:hypothetical protein
VSSVTSSSRSSPPSLRTWLPNGPPVTASTLSMASATDLEVADDCHHPPGFRLPSQRVKRLGPSVRSAPHTPGSSSRLRFQALHRFHGLRPDSERLGNPLPALTGD